MNLLDRMACVRTQFDFQKKIADDYVVIRSPKSMNKHFTIVTHNESPEDRRVFLRMVILNQAFGQAFIQKQRIETGMKSDNLKVLFADIHFFLVAATNIQYALLSVRSEIKSDLELNVIYKKYIRELEHLDTFRDHLEHITDGRIDGFDKKGNRMKNPTTLGNLFGDEYDFGGERFNIRSSFKLLDDLFRDLQEWNQKTRFFPLWGIL